MMNFKNEEAVSPVIGVILMVAITVILAAVIAAFVFGMSGNIETQKSVVVSAKQVAGNNLQLTVQSGADLSTLLYLRVEVTKSDGSSVGPYYAYGSDTSKTITLGSTGLPSTAGIKVGNTYTTSDKPLTDESDHVVIVGHFTDGKAQMLVDATL